MAEKIRLDVMLVDKGIAASRERARTMIMEGNVFVDGVREDKAGSMFKETAVIEYRGDTLKYVSRGGLKLEKALQVFPIDLRGKTCMDIGASTGGFTDCMLMNGAARVYSIDVGYGQLAWKLRSDERVVCMEKTNFRYLKRADFPERPDFASADVSFISLSRILPAAYDIISDDAQMVCLIKPQFEAGKDKVGKKGVVRDPDIHEEVIRNTAAFAADTGFFIRGIDFSPVKGPEGNIEYLLYISKAADNEASCIQDNTCNINKTDFIRDVVKAAHEALDA